MSVDGPMVAGFRHALDHEVVEFRDVRVDATAHAHTAGPHRRAVDARKRLLQRGIVRAEHSAVDEVRLPFHAPGSPGGGPAAKRACFRQLDLAHFDTLNWPTPNRTSIVVPQASAVRD